MIDEVAEEMFSPPELSTGIAGVVRGVFAGVESSGLALVDFEANPDDGPIAAASLVALTRADVGKPVILAFEGGDVAAPVIMGLIKPLSVVAARGEPDAQTVLDGERLVLSAEREVVLRCGDASLTLTSDGKVLIRGHYVLSRASDVNRIKGGTVQIN